MRVTVTGASGLIGGKLSAALRARGDEVIPVSVRARVDPAQIGDAVIHLACISNDPSFDPNVGAGGGPTWQRMEPVER